MRAAKLEPYFERLSNTLRYCPLDGILFKRVDDSIATAKTHKVTVDGARVSIPSRNYVWWLNTGTIPEKRVICLNGDHTNMRMDNLGLFESKLERYEREKKQYHEYIETRSKLEGAELEAFMAHNPEPSYPTW